MPEPERAFGRAHRGRYSLVLRRSQSVTIFVGSTASVSICISTTLPLLSIRYRMRRAHVCLRAVTSIQGSQMRGEVGSSREA